MCVRRLKNFVSMIRPFYSLVLAPAAAAAGFDIHTVYWYSARSMPSLFTVLLLIAVGSLANTANVPSSFRFARKYLGIAAASISLTSPFATVEPVYASVLDAATKEMLYKKDKSSDERDFASLPDATKKRKALALCKDSSARSAARFSSVSQCNEQVFAGNYDAIVKGSVERPAASARSSYSYSSDDSSPVASSPKRSAGAGATVSAPPAATKQLEKVRDLSDLSSAAKKRRSLAACKKPEIRKFAKAGSESKCTETVMNGNFDYIIDALEYDL